MSGPMLYSGTAMSNQPQLPPPGFAELSVEEQITYVQTLWDRIAAQPDRVPLLDWQIRLVEERIAEHRAHPELAEPWESVRDRLLASLGK